MKVIVTGVTGFVGKNLCVYLEKHGVKVEKLSLRDTNWKQKIPRIGQAIIHLAGKAHDVLNTSDDHEYYKVNRDLTIELFSEFLDSEISDFIYFSSVKAVADIVNDVLTEDVTANPKTTYGKSKLAAEQYLLEIKIPQGKRVLIIRPCMVHGPGNKGNLNLLYNVVKKGIPWPLAAFENRRSFLSIDNLNYLLKCILEDSKVESGVYNLADDEHLSTNDLINLISEVNGSRTRFWNISPKLIKRIAKVGDTLHLPLNSERLKKLTENYIVDNSKIKKGLKIEKLPISAEEGIRKTFINF